MAWQESRLPLKMIWTTHLIFYFFTPPISALLVKRQHSVTYEQYSDIVKEALNETRSEF